MANQNINISVDSIGDTVIIPAVSGQVIDVYGFYLVASLGVTAKFRDGTGGSTIFGPFAMITGVPQAANNNGLARFSVSAGNALVINCGLGVQIAGTIEYSQYTP